MTLLTGTVHKNRECFAPFKYGKKMFSLCVHRGKSGTKSLISRGIKSNPLGDYNGGKVEINWII